MTTLHEEIGDKNFESLVDVLTQFAVGNNPDEAVVVDEIRTKSRMKMFLEWQVFVPRSAEETLDLEQLDILLDELPIFNLPHYDSSATDVHGVVVLMPHLVGKNRRRGFGRGKRFGH
ncbi:MAG: hypothetical protein HQL23_09660 [Candidatus Omnitrophica bacterium]|nr:hypothetical protein [Candidatus Omnitrophota bacterium]